MFNLVPVPFAPRAPESADLWHFIRCNQLGKLQTFMQHGIWLSRLDQFKDELEGSLPRPNLGLLQKVLPTEMAESTEHSYKMAALRGYASCWHASEGDPSDEMWESKFGNKGRAIALRTSPARLASTVSRFSEGPGPCYLGEIRYIDHRQDQVPEGNTLEVAFVVQDRFAFQREVRLYAHTLSASAIETLLTERIAPNESIARLARPDEILEFGSEIVGNIPPALGLELSARHDGKAMILPIPASDYIDEILVGPKARADDHQKLAQILRGYTLLDRLRCL
jgi:hypothetical protein